MKVNSPRRRQVKSGGKLLPGACVFIIITFVLVSNNFLSVNQVQLRALYTPFENVSQPQFSQVVYKYIPSAIEDYLFQQAEKLGYNETSDEKKASGCAVWKDPEASPIYSELQTFQSELEDYNNRLLNFNGTVKDLRKHLNDPEICNTLELHEDGLPGIFKSGSLSRSSSGFVEPLLPPLRHPMFCTSGRPRKTIYSLAYLVHDFAAMCRKLKPTSRTVLIDMGASLEFHATAEQPAIYLTSLFHKFGFRFDHIYAYEITPNEPAKVFAAIPDELRAAYHWINVGVDADPSSGSNPLKMLLDNYNEDDFIIIKLDIDTAHIEVPLAYQLLEDDRYSRLVDSFYFEHHVHMKEMQMYWTHTMTGSIQNSFKLFRGLREKGIPAHYWV
jgi:hypothetical protein